MGWQRSRGLLRDFATDRRILGLVKQVLGPSIEFHQTKYNPKAHKRAGKRWDPHRGDSFWCLKDGVPNPDKILTVFIALTDQNEQNGAVLVWSGSHKISLDDTKSHLIGLDRKRNAKKDTSSYLSLQLDKSFMSRINREFKQVTLSGSAGTVWLINSGLVHASPPNNSNSIRVLVANVFRTTDNRPTTPRKQTFLSEPPNGPLRPRLESEHPF
jgi:ectoine hydroxylase-related dioxygenase (phytanoyl-CoA dioxygenase family)